MSAVFSGNTAGAGGMCTDFDLNATQLNSALADAEILTNGVLTLTKIDGSTFTNNIPYFSDFVISGLNLNISNVPVNRTLTYTAGTYQINAQLYSIPVGANFQLTAGHPTLPRIDILYLTNTNNIIYQTGTPATNPVQPTPPLGTLLLAAIGVQIAATTSLNYTLVTVNTNNTTIAPTTIADGTVNGSHLAWDGISWVENPYWIVKNSVIDPTIKIQSYDTTDVNGIITLTTLGDSNSERGFTFYVNDSLAGFNTRVDLTSSLGSETVFSVLSIDNNDFVSGLISNSSSKSRIATIDLTLDRRADISNEAISNILEATLSTKDPLNLNQLVQTITSTNSSVTQGVNESLFSQDLGTLMNKMTISNGIDTCQIIQEPTNNTITTNTGYCRVESDGLLSLSRIDLYNNLTYLYNRDIGNIQNAEINLDYTLGAVLKYEDTGLRNELYIGSGAIELIYNQTANPSFTESNIRIDNTAISLDLDSNVVLQLIDSSIFMNGGVRKRTRNTNVSTAVAANDYMIVATAAPITVTLPAAPINGQEIVVISNGVATGGNPVTINGNGKNINAAATSSIVTSYGRAIIVYNSTLNEWLIIG